MQSQIDQIMQNKQLQTSSEEQPGNSIIIMVNTVPTGGFPPIFICQKDNVKKEGSTIRNIGFNKINNLNKFNIQAILDSRKTKKNTDNTTT
jgi:hypothetical protein